MNNHSSSPSESSEAHVSEGSTRCDCCKSCGAILELDGCGHRFHPRCIYAFPLSQCEVCAAPVTIIKIFRAFQNTSNLMVRKGKWSADEHKYANMMMKQFQMGAMPLVDGLHLRGFIASLLQCDPLRVTKKYSGHAIGKQNFYYQRNKSYCYNLHTKMQKRISSLRNHFYWHIQYRCKFGFTMNIQELKLAEADYWIREFVKFANKHGQRIEFTTTSMTIESPMPSPVKEVQAQSLSTDSPSIKTEVPQPPTTVPSQPSTPAQVPASPPASPVVTVSLAVDTQAQPVDIQYPSFKLDGTNGVVSPLGFDEYSEETTPSFDGMLDNSLLADFAKGGSQFSATLSDILNTQSAKSASESVPMSLSSTLSQSGNSRCSVRDWLIEDESNWNESMAGTSWSFSLPLSDCA